MALRRTRRGTCARRSRACRSTWARGHAHVCPSGPRNRLAKLTAADDPAKGARLLLPISEPRTIRPVRHGAGRAGRLDARQKGRGGFWNRFAPRAFRQAPSSRSNLDRFMALYDRAAERGDPYEERVKAWPLKACAGCGPEFLFRIEQKPRSAGPSISARTVRAGPGDAACRIFSGPRLPDRDGLMRLAEQGRLQDPKNAGGAGWSACLDDLRGQAPRFVQQLRRAVARNAGILGGRVVPAAHRAPILLRTRRSRPDLAGPSLFCCSIESSARIGSLIELLSRQLYAYDAAGWRSSIRSKIR